MESGQETEMRSSCVGLRPQVQADLLPAMCSVPETRLVCHWFHLPPPRCLWIKKPHSLLLISVLLLRKPFVLMNSYPFKCILCGASATYVLQFELEFTYSFISTHYSGQATCPAPCQASHVKIHTNTLVPVHGEHRSDYLQTGLAQCTFTPFSYVLGIWHDDSSDRLLSGSLYSPVGMTQK